MFLGSRNNNDWDNEFRKAAELWFSIYLRRIEIRAKNLE